jgi:hypothetical protein
MASVARINGGNIVPMNQVRASFTDLAEQMRGARRKSSPETEKGTSRWLMRAGMTTTSDSRVGTFI